MIINDQYKDLLLKNQTEYMQYIKKSVYGKIISIPKADVYSSSDDNCLFEENRKIIRRINGCRIMRFVQSLKAYSNRKKYLKNNPQVKKRIKEIEKSKEKKVYLSIACVLKNEGQYIHEWIEFHKKAGVERFYLFDNESTDNILEILKEYIKSGEVVYIPFPGKKIQMDAYNIACKLCKKTTRWLALLDADEFLHPVGQDDLKTVLKEYEDYPGIGVNWTVYGPCGHKKKPDGGLCQNYRYSFEDKNNELNCRIKSIVQPKSVMSVKTSHNCWYKKGRFAVDENKEEIVGDAIYASRSSMTCTMVNTCNILRINHYWTKSEEELRIKCQRGYPDGHPNPDYDSILSRLAYPMKEDWETVTPFITYQEDKKEKGQFDEKTIAGK